jgi:hypothetical protein
MTRVDAFAFVAPLRCHRFFRISMVAWERRDAVSRDQSTPAMARSRRYGMIAIEHKICRIYHRPT